MADGLRWEFDDGAQVSVDMSVAVADDEWDLDIEVRDGGWTSRAGFSGNTSDGVHYLSGGNITATGEGSYSFVPGDDSFPFLGEEVVEGHSVGGPLQIVASHDRDNYYLEASLSDVVPPSGEDAFDSQMRVTYTLDGERRVQVTLVKDMGPIGFVYYDAGDTVTVEGG